VAAAARSRRVRRRPPGRTVGWDAPADLVRLLAASSGLALDEPFAALDALTRADTQAWLGQALAEAPRTVLLVTHDVEEAVVLADRVAVMSSRPGRIIAEIDNPLVRPRRRTDPALVQLRERVLDALGAPP
jgi:ABC-type nitrate/sulfonate/bicarbonate transport system ATPase subunit